MGDEEEPPRQTMTRLAQLCNKRSLLKRSITLLEKKLVGHRTTPLTTAKLEDIVSQLEQKHMEMQILFEEITGECLETDFETQAQEFEDLSLRIESLREELKSEIPPVTPVEPESTPETNQQQPPVVPVQNAQSQVITPVQTPISIQTQFIPHPQKFMLPKLELPTFDGDVLQWMNFSNTFTSAVHNNPNLSDYERLQYLKSAVKGEAAARIQSIQITNENYASAWDILARRYQNRKAIVDSTLQRLLHQPAIQTESATLLRKFVDTINECVRSLKVLKLPVDYWDAIILFILVEKLDPESRKQWELSPKASDLPSFDEFTTFIEQRAMSLSSIPAYKGKQGHQNQQQKQSWNGAHRKQAHVNLATSDQNSKCAMCEEGSHPLFACSTFKRATIPERWTMVKKNRLCFNCLGKGHGGQDCKSISCKRCNHRHHTLLHQETVREPAPTPTTKSIAHVSCHSKTPSQVLLATALVKIADKNGSLQTFRALIDPGSQASVITENCKQKLGMKTRSINVPVTGVGASKVATSTKLVNFTLKSLIDDSFTLEVNALVLPKVTGNLPNTTVKVGDWKHINKLSLADPSFCHPSQIDVLLGADVYGIIFKGGNKKGPQGTPSAFNTYLGWILLGPIHAPIPSEVKSFHLGSDLLEIVQRFWKQEELQPERSHTAEESLCEEHFTKTHSRQDGRYIVQLPFKATTTLLGDSRQIALRRLLHQERKLSQDESKKQEYVKFMDEYLNLGHMELIPNADLQPSPRLQQNLTSIITRFRTHKIAFTADIVKMYRQILVTPEHQEFQLILWRKSPQDPIQEYRLKTVTYGTASAPYLATKALQQLALDHTGEFPLASVTTMNDFYVDDLMSGTSSSENAIELYQQLMGLMSKGGLQLSKWATNDSTLRQFIPLEYQESQSSLSLDDEESLKTLGLRWHPKADYFSFDMKSPPARRALTKRIILSDLAKVFDPLGWLSPATVKSKMFLQKMVKDNYSWDAALPEETHSSWTDYLAQLNEIQHIRIPRCILPPKAQHIQLHGFCDASEKACAAVVYVRSERENGSISVHLVAAKTTIAPIKQINITRLELNSALLLAELLNSVKSSLSAPIEEMHAWSDSEVALCWISAHPSRWKTYIANRVTEIQNSFEGIWHHVGSKENPADCASRGISAAQLRDHPLWWHGPAWLRNKAIPSHGFNPGKETADVLLEARPQQQLIVHVRTDTSSILLKSSSLNRLKRVTAYCRRFILNHRRKADDKMKGPLTVTELDEALLHWIRQSQQSHFKEELNNLSASNPPLKKSKLRFLNPFIDKDGVLRVGGRLRQANIRSDKKHPILLPQTHHLTDLIVLHEHLSNFHAGPQLMLANLQRRFWIVNGREVVRKVVRRCIRCCRHRAETAQQMMGDLPAARVNPARAFLHCGVDYAGPYTLRDTIGKVPKTYKGWIALFVCFSTRAIHIELVSELSTLKFLDALKRFTATRGKCSTISSDCGTNFVGANRELVELLKLFSSDHHNETIANTLSSEGITWNFNPPGAPHMGGLWEAGVKSVKYHLKRILTNTIPTYEELNSMLKQIEGCLNSRPLCPLSSDPNDLSVLTPGHFLIGEALTAIPEPDLKFLKENRLSRWQRLQLQVQLFWTRWSNEYLTRLQQRPKWLHPQPDLKEGTLVIIKEDNLPPLKWKLGRISEVHPGKDGKVRVVTIKTVNGEVKRPIVKLCALPIETSEAK